jgi:glucose uptake protein GlcU
MVNAGYFTAAASALFNGCFAVIFKQYANEVHPLAFTSFFSVGFLSLFVLSIALDSQDVLLTNSKATDVMPEFCPYGLLSGATVAATFNLTWYAVRVPSVGLATAQGIVSTFNALVSFGVGVLLFRNPITSWGEAVAGLCLLCVGIALVVSAKFLSKSEVESEQGSSVPRYTSSLVTDDRLLGPSIQSIEHADDQRDDSSGQIKPRICSEGFSQRLFGWACAAGAGIAGGFTLAGLTLSPAYCQGLVYLPAVGVGMVLTQLAWLGAQGVYYVAFDRSEVTLLASFIEQVRYNTRSKWYVLAGIAAGAIYGGGLLLSLISTYYVGEALAGPIFQFNIIIDGMWGTFLYSEIVGWKGKTNFFAGALLVVAAGTLLAQATD